jgi:hypothetical protein
VCSNTLLYVATVSGVSLLCQVRKQNVAMISFDFFWEKLTFIWVLFVDTLRLLRSCMSSTDPLLKKVFFLLIYHRLCRYINTREFSIKFTAPFAVWEMCSISFDYEHTFLGSPPKHAHLNTSPLRVKNKWSCHRKAAQQTSLRWTSFGRLAGTNNFTGHNLKNLY